MSGAGLEYNRPNRLDVAECVGIPLKLVFLPAADIAKYVGEGNVDIGITGIDVVEETAVDVETILVCKISYFDDILIYLTLGYPSAPRFRLL